MVAPTNHERIGKTLDLLKEGIAPFIEREFGAVHTGAALSQTRLLTIRWNEGPPDHCGSLIAIPSKRKNEEI